MALNLLKGLQTNPQMLEAYKNLYKQINNKMSSKTNPLIKKPSPPDFINDNRVISSMKSLLYLLYKLDIMNFIKAKLHSIFSHSQVNYINFVFILLNAYKIKRSARYMLNV